MKVGLYAGLLFGGGAEKVIVELANGLSAAGDQVYLFADRLTSKDYPVEPDVTVVDFMSHPSENPLKKNLRRTSELRKVCSEQSLDVLVSFLSAPSFRSAAATLGLKTVHIMSVRNDPAKEYPTWRMGLAKLLFHHTRLFVFQTEEARNGFFKIALSKTCVIPNPVDASFFQIVPSKTSETIVSIGRLTNQKNFALLVDAFADIAADYPSVELRIYGEGELKAELEERASRLGVEKRVHLCGRTSDVPRVLAGAKMFVLSSDYEGMPNALMEALAAGLPCVATDCPVGGPRMLILSAEEGLLVKTGDREGLGRAIAAILGDPERARRLGVNAKHRMEELRTEKVVATWRRAVELASSGEC